MSMDQNNHLFNFLLRVADTNLITAQRLSEWTGHGPFLEEDLALTNISLDLLGTARSIYDYASKVEGKNRTEDDLAFLRGERDFFNPLICELPKGDYAFTIARQFFLDAFQVPFYTELLKSKDETVSGIAAKALKESTYHLRHTSSWVERFGLGTQESHTRLQEAVNELWRFTDDILTFHEGYEYLVNEGLTPDLASIKQSWKTKVDAVFLIAEINIPENAFMQHGSLKGVHTEHLGYLLTEMQYLQRTYPGARW
ncbi:MAG: 1,2-phenylacetyl-CoA epoxidase subunit PaaC [Bacteroidota bacterium]|jgi:ring-1,2-phenylacetyl-CoA epoxidase subunit PaaC